MTEAVLLRAIHINSALPIFLGGQKTAANAQLSEQAVKCQEEQKRKKKKTHLFSTIVSTVRQI